MKKTTTKTTIPGGVLLYHLIKNIATIGCFTYLSVYFGSVWIVLLALLFTGGLTNGASTECVTEEPTSVQAYTKDGWKESNNEE